MTTSTRYAIGLDLGGTNGRAAAVDETGRLLASARERLIDRSPGAVAGLLADCVRRVQADPQLHDMKPTGTGLALAAQLEGGTGRVLVAPNLGWRDVPFGALLSDRLGQAVHITNDLAGAALGESRAGAARGHANALLVFVGSGVGSALIIDGRVYRGSHGLAGEFGHMKVQAGGLPCGCGELGCLEAYAGGVNMARRAAKAVQAGRSSLLNISNEHEPTMADIESAARQGDALCCELREEAARWVGLCAANVVTLFNPSVLVLGGGVLTGSPTLRQRVEEVVHELAGRAALRGLKITDAQLGDDAGVVGGAFLAMEQAAT